MYSLLIVKQISPQNKVRKQLNSKEVKFSNQIFVNQSHLIQVLLFRHKMISTFEFSSSQSLFFLWLSQQNESQRLLPVLPVSQPIPVQLEKPIIPVPQTSSSQEEQILEAPLSMGNQRSCKRSSRYGNSANRKDDEADKDYHDPCFNPKKQKKNRNVLSNLVHHLLKYLSGKQMVLEKLEKIIQFHKMSLSTDQFYLILEFFEDKLCSYVTEKNFKTILMGSAGQGEGKLEKIQEFSKVMRILSYKFYKAQCISSVIHSNKLSYESKKLHFQGLKDLLQILQNLLQVETPPAPKAKKSK